MPVLPPAPGVARAQLTIAADIATITYQFVNNLSTDIAAAMGIEPSRVQIVSIVPGSISVTFDVLRSGANELSPTEAVEVLQIAVYEGNGASLGGYQVVSMAVVTLPPVVPAPLPVPAPEPEPEPEPVVPNVVVHVCPQLYLGPDIGFQNVLDYNGAGNSCSLSMMELGAVCADFYDECMSFLSTPDLSPPPPPSCPQVFLGPDIGFQSVMSYHDTDHTCQLSMGDLGRVCNHFFAECMAFLATDVSDGHFVNPEPEPEPEPLVIPCIDDDAAALLASGYDCTTIFARQECVLVYQYCECACSADNSLIDDGVVPTTSCLVVDGFVAPIVGQLVGHDMSLIAGGSPDDLANTATDCKPSRLLSLSRTLCVPPNLILLQTQRCLYLRFTGALVCAMMDGTPGSIASRRYCFSFDWNEATSTCLIGTGAISRVSTCVSSSSVKVAAILGLF